MPPRDRPAEAVRYRTRLVIALGVLVAAWAPASTAWAHEEGESTEGYLLVQQALGHLAHDTGPSGVADAIEKIDDALNADDKDGVDIAELTRARTDLDAGRVREAQALLQLSITEAVSDLEPAVGEETGTTEVLGPLPGREGMNGQDWGFAAASLLVLAAGFVLSVRFRPPESIRRLRRQLTAAPGGNRTTETTP